MFPDWRKIYENKASNERSLSIYEDYEHLQSLEP